MTEKEIWDNNLTANMGTKARALKGKELGWREAFPSTEYDIAFDLHGDEIDEREEIHGLCHLRLKEYTCPIRV